MNANRARLFAVAFLLVTWAAIASGMAEDSPPRNSDYDYDPPVPGSYNLPVIKIAADGALVESTGKGVNLRDLTQGESQSWDLFTRAAPHRKRAPTPRMCWWDSGGNGQGQGARYENAAGELEL